MFYTMIGGFWIVIMVYCIVKLDIANRKRLNSFIEQMSDQSEMIEQKNNAVDVEFEEINEIERTTKILKQISSKSDILRPLVKQAIHDITISGDFIEQLEDLKSISYNPTTFEQSEPAFQLVQRDIVQNAKDIITICIACKKGKKFEPSEDGLKQISQELEDNQRRIEKARFVLMEGAKYATQKDNNSSDLELDSWKTVLEQLNSPQTLGAD